MNEPRQDCWGRMVEPRDGTMGDWFDRRLAEDHCDMCGEPCPATPDITEATGFSVCAACCEQTLEGACS